RLPRLAQLIRVRSVYWHGVEGLAHRPARRSATDLFSLEELALIERQTVAPEPQPQHRAHPLNLLGPAVELVELVGRHRPPTDRRRRRMGEAGHESLDLAERKAGLLRQGDRGEVLLGLVLVAAPAV